MADYLVTDTELTSIADAIRTKGGTIKKLAFPNGFISAIQNIGTTELIDISSSFQFTAEDSSTFTAVADDKFVYISGILVADDTVTIEVLDTSYEPYDAINDKGSIVVIEQTDGSIMDMASYDVVAGSWGFGVGDYICYYFSIYPYVDLAE